MTRPNNHRYTGYYRENISEGEWADEIKFKYTYVDDDDNALQQIFPNFHYTSGKSVIKTYENYGWKNEDKIRLEDYDENSYGKITNWKSKRLGQSLNTKNNKVYYIVLE
jgi:hypothetical protein